MTSEFLDTFRHNAWATRRLIDFCGQLDRAQTAASLPTGRGAMLSTLKHVIGAESYYLSLLSGSRLEWNWDEERQESPAELLAFADDLAAGWESLLAHPVDAGRVITQTRSNGRVMRLKAGVILAQAVHHGNVHREQVSAIITSLGHTPPDVSAWAYGDATGDIVR